MAIKLYREIHGVSSSNAKAAVENLAGSPTPPHKAYISPAAAPPPVGAEPDVFWRRLVQVVLALLAIPIFLAFLGLIVSLIQGSHALRQANSAAQRRVNQLNAKEADKEGWRLLRAGMFEAARGGFTQVVKEYDPANVEAWNGLGWTWLDTEQPQAAKTNFQRALSLDASYPGALNGLGQVYLAQRDYDQAEKYLLQAAPTESAAWYGLARLYLLEGKFDSAKEWAQKVVDSGEADDTARQMLKAAQEKHVSDELRRMIESPPHGDNDTHSTNHR